MGDPKKIRKKFSTPRHPWQRTRIENERELSKEYGLKNKQEFWKVVSQLKNFADQAKRLTPLLLSQKKAQAEKETKDLLEKLNKLGLLSNRATLADVLTLTSRDLLDIRLQTLVFKKGLARTVNQARQFIVHGHIKVDGKKITSPSHLIKLSEADMITFVEKSSLNDPTHPERSGSVKSTEKKPVEAPKDKEEKASVEKEDIEESKEKNKDVSEEKKDESSEEKKEVEE